MEIKIDKKLKGKELKRVKLGSVGKSKGISFRSVLSKSSDSDYVSSWNFVYSFILLAAIFTLLVINVAKLQIVEGSSMLKRSESNTVRITSIPAYRGVVFDRDGEKLVENISAMNVYISLSTFLKSDGLDNESLATCLDTLGGIVGDNWEKEKEGGEYTSIFEMVISKYAKDSYTTKILLASDIDNETAIKIKARESELIGITLDNGNKRHYIYSEYLSHILGYVGEASSTEIDEEKDIASGDIIGKIGLEKEYDDELRGTDGKLAEEVDALGRSVSSQPYVLNQSVSGKNAYISIDKGTQEYMYNLLKDAVKKNGAVGAAGVIEDVNTGEILALVSYPSYDNNLFVGGISQKEYSKILKNKSNPLLNRAIGAQIPPGSTFKTIVASAGLDSGAITSNTIYISRTGYTFSNGASFQEFRNHSYGALNVVSALTVSSNIFFCELIRGWDMDELVPYLEKFGIGSVTGIDIPGEASGRLPSPENKIKLANSGSYWLDPIWYPEGDSCNSVIGQGITLVTPIQMANWMSAIANGGTLNTPHLLTKYVDENGNSEVIQYEPKYTNIASKDALNTVKKGMYETVYSSRGVAGRLASAKVKVAAKTGTAEFGKVNEKGIYEDTHAWVGGFFPYDNPQYSFSILLEDGGQSSNATPIMLEMINWMVGEGMVK